MCWGFFKSYGWAASECCIGPDNIATANKNNNLTSDAIEKFGPKTEGLRIPQGLTKIEFDKMSSIVRGKADELGLGDDIFVQGSRAGGTAKAGSDIDIAIRVSPEKFDEIINNPKQSTLSNPTPGKAKDRTRITSIEEGRIQTGEARLRGLRDQLEEMFGKDVQISIIRKGGNFDNGPQSPLSFDFSE